MADRRTVEGRTRQHGEQIRVRIGLGDQTGIFGHYDALPDYPKSNLCRSSKRNEIFLIIKYYLNDRDTNLIVIVGYVRWD